MLGVPTSGILKSLIDAITLHPHHSAKFKFTGNKAFQNSIKSGLQTDDTNQMEESVRSLANMLVLVLGCLSP
jgi:hypothetical protein